MTSLLELLPIELVCPLGRVELDFHAGTVLEPRAEDVLMQKIPAAAAHTENSGPGRGEAKAEEE